MRVGDAKAVGMRWRETKQTTTTTDDSDGDDRFLCPAWCLVAAGRRRCTVREVLGAGRRQGLAAAAAGAGSWSGSDNRKPMFM